MIQLATRWRQKLRMAKRSTALRAALSLCLLAALSVYVDFGAALAAVFRADAGLLALLLALFLFERIVVTFRWWLLLPGTHRMPFRAMLDITMTSSFLGLFLPGTVGFDALRIYGVARSTGGLSVTLASFAVERFFALAGMFGLVLAGVALAPTPETGAIYALGWIGAAGLVALAAGALVLMMRGARLAVERLLVWLRFPALAAKLALLHASLDYYRSRPALIAVTATLGIAFQFLRVLQGLVAGLAVGLTLDIGVWLAVVPLVMLALLMPISLFGLGIRDLSLVYLLGLFGVAADLSVAVAILLALMTVLAGLPGAWIYWRRGLVVGT